MPKKIPLCRIGVSREGKTVYPPTGKAFDFTAAEVADLTDLAKKTSKDYIRDPVNEEAPDAPVSKKGSKAAPKAAESKSGEGGETTDPTL